MGRTPTLESNIGVYAYVWFFCNEIFCTLKAIKIDSSYLLQHNSIDISKLSALIKNGYDPNRQY